MCVTVCRWWSSLQKLTSQHTPEALSSTPGPPHSTLEVDTGRPCSLQKWLGECCVHVLLSAFVAADCVRVCAPGCLHDCVRACIRQLRESHQASLFMSAQAAWPTKSRADMHKYIASNTLATFSFPAAGRAVLQAAAVLSVSNQCVHTCCALCLLLCYQCM